MIPITWFTWIAYDEAFCESARLSKEFNSKIELLLKSGVKNIKLSDVTDFEWDVVCVYGEEGESINLEDPNLAKQIGYKPRFLIRSTYYVPYDFVGFVFSDSKTEKIRVLHRVGTWWGLGLEWENIKYPSGCSKLEEELSLRKTKFINHLIKH
jgi:hypothetical protein